MFEMAEKINEIKAQRQQQSEEQKRKMDEEIKRLEAELEGEKEREELRLADREAERAARRVKAAQEQEAAKQLSMAQRGMTEEEKEKLMREHEENMAKFEANLKKEQDKTKAALRDKLEARRKKKKEAEMQKIKAAAKDEMQAADRKEKQETSALQKQEADILRASTPTLPKAPTDTRKKDTVTPDATPVITAGLPEGVSEQDWVSMLMGSPIFDSVNEIENMLKNNIGEGGVAGAKGGRPYIDVKDAQWLCKGDLVPVDINELSPANFVVYRFGVFITQMLQKAMDTPEVTLLLASNLPSNNYERNAFRNSFFYEHARKVLFVRQERMESVGDFLVVIMHALSHIKIDDLVDDQNPLFLREFYKAIRICCQDMFFARSRNTSTARGLVGGVSSASPLETALKPARTMTEKVNVVGELVNIKVSSPIDADFSVQGITERLARKNAFVTRAKLKEYLSSARASSSKKEEFAVTRLKELRGEKTEEEQRPKSRKQVKTGLKSPKELLERQINDFKGRVDTLNTELARVLKTESDLNSNVGEMEQDDTVSEERLEIMRKQLVNTEQRKNNLLMKVDYVEEEIAKKTKELKALK
ncbi:PREDICTED: uncharacterized protein LOC107354046 isoform X1 [Acropora digitifera]|uniref:uncharacterized protein LOC107354046 isoform X1 n=1 Tax=Acropora digitifera TaxID=70779 RepID=UPI00077AF193|nr:PREDICTED: uncharacterized protein LOC107354046 isoform X1 [Acropora digitifera]